MLRLIFLVPFLVLVFAACDDHAREIFNPEPSPKFNDDERKKVQADIALLAQGKDHTDIEASAIYSETVEKLTLRGSKIESQLIEALVGNQDWAVRMGVIEVLESVAATKECVEPLIAATKDPVPLVALRANKLLETLTGNRVIPAAGSPASAAGLAPVPRRKPEDFASDAEEKLWAAWHQEHAKLLNETWRAWWKENRGTVKLQ